LDINIVKHRLLECDALARIRKKVDVSEFSSLGSLETVKRLSKKVLSGQGYCWGLFILPNKVE